MEGQATVINPDGSLAYRLGRRGQGPGEFISPSGVGWRGDTLLVVDVAQQRVSYFIRDAHIRTSRFETPILRAGSQVASQVPLPAHHRGSPSCDRLGTPSFRVSMLFPWCR